MIRTIKTILLILVLATAAAAVPNYINYQGVLRDSAGNLVTGNRAMVFTIYDQATGGTSLWTVTSPEVAVANGLYTIQLTGITPAVLGSGDRWLEVAVAGTTLTPRLRIAAVAYAVTAASAESASTLGGYSAAASGNNIIPVTDGTGKLDSTVIPAAGVNVSHASTADYATVSGTATNAASADTADYATVSGTASNAAAVGGYSASNSPTPGELLTLDPTATRFSGIAVSAEATAPDFALYITGRLGCSSTEGISYRASGTGTITGAGVDVNNSLVTARSHIIITPQFTGAAAGYKWLKVDSVNPGTGFRVETFDGGAPVGAQNFYYLIIN